jgi:hypothetical protein
MFNFFASFFLSLIIIAGLGGQLATAAHRNSLLPRPAVAGGGAPRQFVRAISPKRPA